MRVVAVALAALSAAFVPQQPRLAARIRADEIEAAEDAADAEPRTAPEVNSGAERCRNRIVATRPRHRRDACSMAWRCRFLTGRFTHAGAEAVELLFKDPEGYKLARDEYNKKMKEEIMEEGAPDRAFLLQAAAVGLGSFLFGLYGPKRKDD